MGKNFPQRTNLKESPSLRAETLALIEKSFQYQSPFSFEQDFAPLMDPANSHNSFVYTDESGKVVAHIGAKEKIVRLGKSEHTICLLGGIAVDEAKRGEGLFRSLMEDVLSEKRSDCAFFLLWSDQEKLYQKFGFTLAGAQYEYGKSGKPDSYLKSTYSSLSEADKKSLRSLFENSFARTYLTPLRTEEDWKIIERMGSADLYIKKKGEELVSYFFLGKGQDLTGIIYEYGFTGNLEDFTPEIRAYGTVWTGTPVAQENTQQFQFMLAPADRNLFTSFIADYTKAFLIREVSLMKGEVFFDFGEETLMLEIPEFLRGVFGPGAFEELGEIRPLFLSGLDSV